MRTRLRPERWRRQRGRRMRRIGTLLAAVLLLIGIVVLALRPHHLAPTPASSATSATSARHHKETAWLHAGAPWTSGQAAQLHSRLATLAASPAFPASTGMLVLDGRDGEVLYSRNAMLPLTPGSTIKLVTAAAALDALGPDYRFTTSIVTDTAVDGALLNGSIWLVGGGDPELTSDDLRRGVQELRQGGIARVAGDVYADGSRYGPDRVSPTWQADDLQYGWAAPASALSVDGGSVQFTITPHLGSEATVAVDPPGQHVIASVDTAGASGDNTLQIDRLPDDTGYVVRGQIPYGAPQKYWRAVPHPTRTAAVSLFAMMRLAGVDVAGSPSEGTAPTPSTSLWQHKSRTLDLITKHMFFLSDNHYAEELLRAVGWKATGLGLLDNSLATERSFMQANAIPLQGVVIADGSGLSAQNRLSAQTLGQTLRFILKQPLAQPPFALLPRAGIEGTVKVRDLDVAAKGRVFAKDGYIEGASAIAGYVLTAHHGPVIFVFMVNNWEHGLDAVWADEDKMLDVIAGL